MAIQLDVNLSLADQIGAGGLRREDLVELAPRVKAAHRQLVERRKNGTLPFLDLPKDKGTADASKRLAEELKREHDNLLVLGIGGSSLGAKALFTGLTHPMHNFLPAEKRGGLRMFFPDNADPSTFSALLDVLELSRTATAMITKSGGTAETWAQMLVLRNRYLELGGEGVLKKHVVAVTDPEKGALRQIAGREGWRTLPVPPGVGGRFSVLTPVGLLPAAAAGIDIDALLQGAADMVERCQTEDVFKNPAYLAASVLYLMDQKKGRRIHVFMPYADALRETSDWFVQLWAESLGKREDVGPTPLRAVGATDQHSLVQLLMEGPQDKMTVFLRLNSSREDQTIPSAWTHENDVAYLGGHSMQELVNVEHQATAAALASSGRPSMTLRMSTLGAVEMGELMMMWEIATAFAGSLYGVDPFNQPGVEGGKRYIGGLFGRPGYEKYREELEQRPARPEWIV